MQAAQIETDVLKYLRFCNKKLDWSRWTQSANILQERPAVELATRKFTIIAKSTSA